MRVTACLFAGALVLLAADFWETKDPRDWSASEIERILTDSPWAHEADVSFVGDRSSPIGGGGNSPGQRSGRSRTPGGIGLPDGGWGAPFTTGGLQASGMGKNQVIVRWSSALPIRQALRQVDALQIDERPDLLRDYYIVSLTHVPAGMARLSDTPERLRTAARLTPKGRGTILAERIEVRPQPGTPGIDLYFPRGFGIGIEDRNVVFELSAESYVVSAKFKPREMAYRDEFGL